MVVCLRWLWNISGANASSDVKTVLQRHILSKRLSANAVLALNSKLNQQHVAAAAAASGAGIVSSGLSHTFSSQSLQTSPSSNNSSAHHSPPHRDVNFFHILTIFSYYLVYVTIDLGKKRQKLKILLSLNIFPLYSRILNKREIIFSGALIYFPFK